jgi:uncharacterized membrane protein (DUF485 family)
VPRVEPESNLEDNVARPTHKAGDSSGATAASSLHKTRTDGERAVYEELHATDEFRDLRRRYRAFAFPWTVAFLAWYLLYVVLSNWAGEFMAAKVVGHINVALVFGLLQFATTFGIAYLYARHANRRFDPIAEELEERFNRATGRHGTLHGHVEQHSKDAR